MGVYRASGWNSSDQNLGLQHHIVCPVFYCIMKWVFFSTNRCLTPRCPLISTEAVHKKSLFPVQRVAVIVASRAAAMQKKKIPNFFLFGRTMLSILQKLKKKDSSCTFFRHPAGPLETEFFFRLARWELNFTTILLLLKQPADWVISQ